MTKLPPQNLEAEQSILGGIMVDPNALDRVVDIISENDFYKAANRKIYLVDTEFAAQEISPSIP